MGWDGMDGCGMKRCGSKAWVLYMKTAPTNSVPANGQEISTGLSSWPKLSRE